MGENERAEPDNARAFKKRTKLTQAQSQEVCEEVRENVQYCYMFERDNRREAEIDLAFVAGDQWPQAVKQIRGNSRPMLTINQLPQFVNQVVNPTRSADIAIQVVGVDDQTDPQLASIYDQLIKQVEYQSNAKQVYVTGHEHQVKCGVGYWRVCMDYADTDSFDQEIYLKKIRNPLSVYFDPGAILPDGSDGYWVAVVEQWPRKTFKKKWPKASSEDGVDIPANASPAGFLWVNEDYIAVAEYYRKEPVKRLMAQLENGSVIDITKMDDQALEQIEQESPIANTREITDYKVMKYVVSGKEVLEKPVEWPGKYLPIVRVMGGETPMKHTTLRYGVVRFARDPQQLMNFYRTATAEAVALAPKTPWVVPDEMIQGYLGDWNTVNTTNKPYLRYKPLKDFPSLRPQRESPPDVPVALIQEAQFAADDMKRVTGIYDASMGARSNETSGRAIAARDMQGDTANMHFSDNLIHALTHTGRILIDLIPRVYDNQRVIRLTNPQGKEQAVHINRVLYEVDGKPIIENDLSAAKFDVRVTVGKNYLTKRAEAVAGMMEFAKALPPQLQVLMADFLVENSEWPKADELAQRIRNMLPPQALADPNDPNAPKPPSPMDDPNVVANLEKMGAQIEEMKQRTRKTWAETQKTLAETDLLDGQIDQQFAGIPLTEGDPAGQGQQQQPSQPPKGFQGGSMTLQ